MKTNVLFLFSLLILALPILSNAQEKLITPKGTALAYEKQTRQKNGLAGKNYWQNSADYVINASVDVTHKQLTGQEKITYYNNSPDTLKKIVIRLYQDVFKKGNNRNAIVPVSPLDIHEGVIIKRLQLNTTNMDLATVKRDGTLMTIALPEKLAPHQKTTLQLDWEFPIPEHTLIRMGTIDNSSLFIGQWYPQIAVYDDINGWDTHSYNGMAEFYNDFSNFDVAITVPENFMVWATGEPQNMNEVLQPNFYNRYKKATTSNEIMHVITEEDLAKGNITTKNTTWKYKATQVGDFAFGISNHYLWDVSSVEVDKTTKRRTIVGVAYNKNSAHFNEVATIARETIKALSEDMPGVPYPFPYLTVYNGDFGMEYPMITNVGTEQDFGMTVYANSHEITHAYFPLYVGTNETRSGWLDEGFTVFLPEKIQGKLAPSYNVPKNNTKAFSNYSGSEDEPSLITPTYYLDAKIYFYLNYAKTEQALRMLEMELGNETFKKCLVTFIEQWKLKHPTALDFFNTFGTVANQDLNWFWQAWYYQNGGIPDLAITNATRKENQFTVTVENKGNLPMPVVLSFYNKEKLVKTMTQSASGWQHQNKISVTLDTPETITTIKLGTDIISDANKKDNEYSVN